QRYADARITAIDIDDGAVSQALINVRMSPFADRIEVLHERLQDHRGTYDAIVSNPPFFVDSLKAPDQQRSMARHADTLTYSELMAAAHRLLSDDGELSVIVPFDYRRRMDDEAVFVGFFPSRVCGVRTTATKPVRRYLLSYRKNPCPCTKEEIVIGDARYKEMTSPFYL
ncbi:MAG: methyltransferase, partial [Prevotella sp.]|nr:methyltransferase [Prevotella sp.]